jgi:CRISPR-associated endonuclease/helicase Cas3
VTDIDFDTAFLALTANPPFPWQQSLYERFVTDEIPSSCDLPTGLGKTSVIAVWLIALANRPDRMPRRLVYVVNRRTVVDQTTDEVEKYHKRTVPGIPDFAISTLRGQFADNREWSADPSRPAVICGTVDMIGSRLLFSGYGCGFKTRPLHAGFLGQDVLLIHDEAHLEPAFQELVVRIQQEQDERERSEGVTWPKLRVMELTATTRGTGEVFGLTDRDLQNATVKERVEAKKAIHLHPLKDAKKLAEQLVELAKAFEDKNRAVLVFARTVEDVMKVADKLPKDRVITLTGTMRGKERNDLVEHAIFKRFLPGGQSDEPTTYLVCTSAGEVGVNISADHLVCDLSTFESMAQRFGRVNRFGKRDNTEIHVVCPTQFEDKDYEQRQSRTLKLLEQLNGDGSPAAIGKLDPKARTDTFAPTPQLLDATDILFDAWALTTIRERLPGRPHVEPYLHGLPVAWEPQETHVAWRDGVEFIVGDLLREYKPADLLDDYPLKPHELLREPSHRAFKQFEAMAKRLADRTIPVWLLDEDGKVEVLTLKELADKDNKERIEGKTVLLPPAAGGLERGMLSGTATAPEKGSLDVADELFLNDKDGNRVRQRKRLLNTDPEDDEEVKDMHPVRTIVFPGPADDEDAEADSWQWFVLGNEGDKAAKKPVEWKVHVKDVTDRTKEIVARLPLDQSLKDAIIFAARFHDHGKKRKLFQTVLGNTKYHLGVILAKSGKRGGRIAETYRHEFGSLLDVEKVEEFKALGDNARELVLHLIATHHGRARPHFPRTTDADEAFDPEHPPADADRVAAEVPRRFARLQRKYGRWGLAYLESLLRAADWAASAKPSEFVKEDEQ